MTAHATQHIVDSADGTQIGVSTVGSGPPVVLVHGAWDTSGHWQQVATGLADRVTCHALDRRGRGRSGDSADYSFDREVEDIDAVVDGAGDDVTLFGHSSGAIYALEAARHAAVSRLVLYEPPLNAFGRPEWDELRDRWW